MCSFFYFFTWKSGRNNWGGGKTGVVIRVSDAVFLALYKSEVRRTMEELKIEQNMYFFIFFLVFEIIKLETSEQCAETRYLGGRSLSPDLYVLSRYYKGLMNRSWEFFIVTELIHTLIYFSHFASGF